MICEWAKMAGDKKIKKQAAEGDQTDFEKFVRTALNTLSEQISDVIKGQKSLESKFDNLDIKVKENTKKIEDLEKGVTFQDNRLDDLEKRDREIQDSIDSHTKRAKDTEDSIKSLQSKLVVLERYTRGFNLRFLKVKEKPRENSRDLLCELLKDNMKLKDGDDPAQWIEYAHRTGGTRDGAPRQLIARFHSRVVRSRVIRELRAAKPDFIVLDDLTPEDLKEKRRVAPAMEKLYRAGKEPRFFSGRLFAKKKLVTEAQIARLLSNNEEPNLSHDDDTDDDE